MYLLALSPGGPPREVLRSLARATPSESDITVVTDRRWRGTLAECPQARVLELPAGASVGAALNQALSGRENDFAVLDGTCAVADGWLSALGAAAWCDGTVAGATAMTDRPGEWCVPVSGGSPSAAVAAVALHATRLRPRLASAGAHASYIRRAAFALVGGFDERPESLGEVLAAFSARARRHGLSAVLADDVFLASGEDLSPEANPLGGDTALDRGPLRRSLVLARRALRGLTVTLDARDLAGVTNGSQAHTSQLAFALAGTGEVRLRAVVAPDLDDELGRSLQEAGVALLSYEEAAARPAATDIVHRPQQIFTPADLQLLVELGDRLLITHHDLIAYRIPDYHASLGDWHRYRQTARLSLAGADRVLFSSRHALEDALADDLVEPAVAEVIGIGVDGYREAGDPRRPDAMDPHTPFLLMLGSDYAHKNRPFAMTLLRALRSECGWMGSLVLAGPHVAHGSSRDAELALLAEDPQLQSNVVELGTVDERERAWLLGHASALCYPSAYEGFGLVPFEAARAGIPCLYAPQSSLADVVGVEAATLVPWDADASAGAAVTVLRDGPARELHVARLVDAGARHRWRDVADATLAAYDHALSSAYRPSAARAHAELAREGLLAEHAAERARLARLAEQMAREAGEQQTALRAAMARDFDELVGIGLPLIREPRGLLSRREQRGLMRIAARRWSHRLALWPLALLGGRGDGSDEGRGRS